MERLGYPTSVDKMKSRINAISSNASYHTLVVDYNGRVVGMGGFCTNLFYEYDGSYVRIVAFVVTGSTWSRDSDSFMASSNRDHTYLFWIDFRNEYTVPFNRC